jgi:tripartite-type tricarboxylate transporter receptor subunit TctC
MLMVTRRLAVQGLALTILALAPSMAHAAYPERPITIIIPFPPGGGTDLSARIIVPYMEKYMPGAKFVAVNKAGAGGAVGALEIATTKPDGYTIGLMNVPNTMMKAHERDTRWTIDSFVAIANLVFDPAVFAAVPGGKFKDLKDVLEQAKKRPGELTVSSAGVGSNTHLDLIALEKASGTKFSHVPFEGGAAARNALMGGHVDLMASGLGDVHRFVADGKLLPLAIYTKTRSPLSPNIPTLAEQGFDIVQGSARGLVGPKDMPKEAVTAIAAAVEKALKDPELLKKTDDVALPLQYMGPDEYAAYLKASNADLAKLWKESPWK